MNFGIDWIDGAPDETHEGQIILWPDNTVSVIGCEVSEDLKEQVHEGAKAWAWVLQPHQLDWIADMAQRHGKGRPEQ